MNVPVDHSGQVLGNWRLLRPLGVGGFGTVYEAEHHTIPGRRSAVKVLHPQMALNADIKRRFINEASAASRADHENIVQVFDGGVSSEGLGYVAMELLRGQTLGQALDAGPLGVARTLNIAIQITSALEATHTLGIIHRDLKPDNVMLVRRSANPEFVKVLDFGVAKLQTDQKQTKTGVLMGTPMYMAPEQWETLPDVDGRADLYALGAILYECLTGRPPYDGPNTYALLMAHMNNPVPDPAKLAPETPAELSDLVQRLLAKGRNDRPPSATKVLGALRRISGQPDRAEAKELPAEATRVLGLQPSPSTPPSPERRRRSPDSRRPRRRPAPT